MASDPLRLPVGVVPSSAVIDETIIETVAPSGFIPTFPGLEGGDPDDLFPATTITTVTDPDDEFLI